MALLIGDGVCRFANVTVNRKLDCQVESPYQLVSLLLIMLLRVPVFCKR